MATFPTFHNAVISQYPYRESDLFTTTQSYLPAGFAYTSTWTAAQQRQRFVVHFDVLETDERQQLESFWLSVGGPSGTFSFTDDQGLTHNDCNFEDDALAFQYVGPNQHSTDVRILALS